MNYVIPPYHRISYGRDVVRSAATAAGFSAHLDIMVAIAGAESSWSNAIQLDQPYATTGWGTWQITPGNSVPSVGVDLALLDVYANARAARWKFDHQGLHAWTTYTNGVYRKYL
jgi:hypothetical protein